MLDRRSLSTRMRRRNRGGKHLWWSNGYFLPRSPSRTTTMTTKTRGKSLPSVRPPRTPSLAYPKSSPDRQPIPTWNPGQSSINYDLLQLLDNWLKTICTNQYPQNEKKLQDNLAFITRFSKKPEKNSNVFYGWKSNF